jgi:hypothetical protein
MGNVQNIKVALIYHRHQILGIIHALNVASKYTRNCFRDSGMEDN